MYKCWCVVSVDPHLFLTYFHTDKARQEGWLVHAAAQRGIALWTKEATTRETAAPL